MFYVHRQKERSKRKRFMNAWHSVCETKTGKQTYTNICCRAISCNRKIGHSVTIESSNGAQYRRNTSHLKRLFERTNDNDEKLIQIYVITLKLGTNLSRSTWLHWSGGFGWYVLWGKSQEYTIKYRIRYASYS